MRKEVILITGANGEIGHGLITHLGKNSDTNIVAIDVQPLDEALLPYCERFIQGDILDNMLLGAWLRNLISIQSTISRRSYPQKRNITPKPPIA